MSKTWGGAGGASGEAGRAGGAVELGRLGANPTPPPGSKQTSVSASAKGGNSLSTQFHIRIKGGTINVKREACFIGWINEVYNDFLMNKL